MMSTGRDRLLLIKVLGSSMVLDLYKFRVSPTIPWTFILFNQEVYTSYRYDIKPDTDLRLRLGRLGFLVDVNKILEEHSLGYVKVEHKKYPVDIYPTPVLDFWC